MFQNFRCKDIEGQSRLYKDLEILCWESTHSTFSFALALPSIFIWGIGIPLFGLLQIIKNRNLLDKISIRKKYGFLYRGYRKKFYFWDILIMYRKVIIIGIAVFIINYGVIVQTLIVLVVVFM